MLTGLGHNNLELIKIHILIYSPINESNVAMDSKKEIQPPKAKETNKLDSLFPPEVKRTPKKLETEQKTSCPVTPQQTQQGRKYHNSVVEMSKYLLESNDLSSCRYKK